MKKISLNMHILKIICEDDFLKIKIIYFMVSTIKDDVL